MLPVIVVLVLVVGALGLVAARRRASAPGRHAAARRPDAATGVPALLAAVAPPVPVEQVPVEQVPVEQVPVREPLAQPESDAAEQVVAEAEQVVADAEQAVLVEQAPTTEPASEPAAEPAAELTPAPNVTAPQPAAEPVAEPVAEAVAEAVAEPGTEPTVEPASEPIARTPKAGKPTTAAAARTRRTTVSVDAGTAPRVRRCGHCRTPGHTRTTCPDLTGAQA